MTVVRDRRTARDVSTGDAAFRAWAQMIHDALAGVGLVNTADTGQINLSTVTTPAVGSFAGYEIWRFADSNQANDPIYFKIEYGRSSTVRPNMRFTFGTGSDGAGTLTNASSTTTISFSNDPTAGISPELHVCHVDGTFILWEMHGTQSNFSQIAMCIERCRDQNGNVITSGSFQGWMIAATSSQAWQRRSGAWTTNLSCCQSGPGGWVSHGGKEKVGNRVLGDNNPFIGWCYVHTSLSVGGGQKWGNLLQVQVGDRTRTYRVMEANQGTGGPKTVWGSDSLVSSVFYAVLSE